MLQLAVQGCAALLVRLTRLLLEPRDSVCALGART